MRNNIRVIVEINSIKKYIFCTLFIMLISMPFVYKGIKISLIALLLLFTIVNLHNYFRTPVNKNLLYVILIFVATNLYFVLVGFYNHNIGAWATLPVNLVWPVLYVIIILDARFYIEFKEIELIFKISLAVISSYVLLFYLNVIFGIPIVFNENLIRIAFDPANPTATANQIFLSSAIALFFLVPYFLSTVLVSKGAKISDYIFLFLGVLVSMATGRRALILLIFVSPMIIFMLSLVLPYRKRSVINRILKRLVIISIIIAVGIVILNRNKIIDVNFLVHKTVSYLIPSESGLEAGALTRKTQRIALLDKWKEKPLLGFGYGSSADGYIRNPKTPWAYELSYVGKLMNIGIIGLGVYIFFISYLIFNLSYHLKNNYVFYISTITGFIIVLVANSTNPYLDSFEYMWVIYFQILFILIGYKTSKNQVQTANRNIM